MAKEDKEEILPSYDEYLKRSMVPTVSFEVDEPPGFSSRSSSSGPRSRRDQYLERIRSNIPSKYIIFHTFILGAFTIYLLLIYATLVMRDHIYVIGIPGLITCFSSIICLATIYRYVKQKTFFRFISLYIFNGVTLLNFCINIIICIITFFEQLHNKDEAYSASHLIVLLLIMTSFACFFLTVALLIILTIKVFCQVSLPPTRAVEPEL